MTGTLRKVAVGLGLAEFPFREMASFWRWVDLCEAEGIDSLWQTDRLISRQAFLEPLSAMAALAGRTRRMRFGMNVLSLAYRDPVLVAKQCATIDALSEGRLLPAFGIGSPKAPEWTALGLDTATRGRRTDEALDIIVRLWRQESVDFQGRFHRLTGASIAPRPVQPDLPVWIGGSTEAAIRRTGRIGTGWQAGGDTPEDVARIIPAIRAAAAEHGRAIDEDHYGAAFAFRFGRPDDAVVSGAIAAYARRTGRDASHVFAVGDADTILERITDYVAAGVSKFILRPIGTDDADVIGQTQRLIDSVLPRVAARWPRPASAPPG